MQSLVPQILAPVMLQIVASHIARDKVGQPELVAFTATVVLVNLPMAILACVYRAAGVDFFLAAEARASASTILQMLYYYEYATETWQAQGATVLMMFAAGFMNEVTMSGGDWFGHRAIAAMNMFFCLRTLAGIAESAFGSRVMRAWGALVAMEFCVMSALPLFAIWEMFMDTPWFVPAFMMAVPIAFPTSNWHQLPSEARGGFLAMAPVCVAVADREKSKDKD